MRSRWWPRFSDRGAHRINPAAVARISPNAVASQIGIRYGFQGPEPASSRPRAPRGPTPSARRPARSSMATPTVCITGGVEAPLTQFNFPGPTAPSGSSPGTTRIHGRGVAARSSSRARRVRDERGRGGPHPRGAGARAAARRPHPRRGNRGCEQRSGAHHMVMPESDGGTDAARTMAAAGSGMPGLQRGSTTSTPTRPRPARTTSPRRRPSRPSSARRPAGSRFRPRSP